MTHNQPRAHWTVEGAIALAGGLVYGTTYIGCSYPLDTIKTKMQAQAGFEGTGVWQTLTKTLRTHGVIGLYRGVIPPLWGSALYRSAQFAAFEGTYTFLSHDAMTYEIPLTAGLQPRVILGGIMSGLARGLIECPLEYAKVKRQTNQSWHITKIFTGLKTISMRSSVLQVTFFVIIDSMRRNKPHWFTYPFAGPFMTAGCAAVVAWGLAWPFEYIRTQVQAGYISPNASLIGRFRQLAANGGLRGLFRGVAPGLTMHFIGCGFGMLAFQAAQRKATEFGLRDWLSQKK